MAACGILEVMGNVQQIKSRRRVADYGEVFTGKKEVKAMVNLVHNQVNDIDATFLEPACGTGNFLDEVLMQKMRTVSRTCCDDQKTYAVGMIRAVSSLYGIDIMQDNVDEVRKRMMQRAVSSYTRKFGMEPSAPVIKTMHHIIDRNVQCGNTLSGKDSKGRDLVISEWRFMGNGLIMRLDFRYMELVDSGSNAPPFAEYEPVPIGNLADARRMRIGITDKVKGTGGRARRGVHRRAGSEDDVRSRQERDRKDRLAVPGTGMRKRKLPCGGPFTEAGDGTATIRQVPCGL